MIGLSFRNLSPLLWSMGKGGYSRPSPTARMYGSPVMRRVRRVGPPLDPLMRKSVSLSAVDAPLISEPEIKCVAQTDDDTTQEDDLSTPLDDVESSSSPSEILDEDAVDGSTAVDRSSMPEPLPGIKPAGQVYNFGTLPRFYKSTKGFVPKMRLMFERAASLEPELR